MSVYDPEAPSFIQVGNVMYSGVASMDEVDSQLREAVLPQEKVLNSLLAESTRLFIESGIAQKVVDLCRARSVYEAKQEIPALGRILGPLQQDDPEEFRRLSQLYRTDPESFMEEFWEEDWDETSDPLEFLEERMLRVDEDTEYRAGERIEAEEPCDPSAQTGIMYMNVYNGSDHTDQHLIEVGGRIYGSNGESDTFIPSTPGIPQELFLTRSDLATIGSRIDLFKREMAGAGRLPNLGESGRFDTLVFDISSESKMAEAA